MTVTTSQKTQWKTGEYKECLVKNQRGGERETEIKSVWELWTKKRKPAKLSMCLQYQMESEWQDSTEMEMSKHLVLSKHPYVCVKRLRGLKLLELQNSSIPNHIKNLVYLGDLFSVIQDNDGLSVSYCKTFSLQLAHAIDFLHKMGVVHRNINTENVFIFERQKRPLVKLSCFDYACTEGTTQSNAALIARKLKTNPFAPPEIAQLSEVGDKKFSLTSSSAEDAWAFAVVIFCMITNHYPWRTSYMNDEHYISFKEELMGSNYEKVTQLPYPWSEFSHPLITFFRNSLQEKPTHRIGRPADIFSLVCDFWLKAGAQSTRFDRN